VTTSVAAKVSVPAPAVIVLGKGTMLIAADAFPAKNDSMAKIVHFQTSVEWPIFCFLLKCFLKKTGLLAEGTWISKANLYIQLPII
jgi:hypothetical protein